MGQFNMNQFKLSNQPGETMNVNPDTISVRISKDEASYYLPGFAVKLVAAEVSDAPVVEKAALGDVVLGIVLSDPKKAKKYAYDMAEIGITGTIVTMLAGTAFNRGDVYFVPSTGYIAGTTGVRIGIALDIASAAGDIVRVLVAPKSA